MEVKEVQLVTVRSVPILLWRKIKSEAMLEGLTVNQYVIRLFKNRHKDEGEG